MPSLCLHCCGQSYHLCRRSVCDDIEDYLNIPVPLDGDTTIELDLRRVNCPELDGGEQLDEIVVRGGTLTISSESTLRYDIYHCCAACFVSFSESE